jgi:hypothetical protein
MPRTDPHREERRRLAQLADALPIRRRERIEQRIACGDTNQEAARTLSEKVQVIAAVRARLDRVNRAPW